MGMRIPSAVALCLALASCKGTANSDPADPNDPNNPNNPTDPGSTGGWLRTEGNKILLSDGSRFHGRGVNIFDTRDAGACAWAEPIVDEWIRRIDVLIDDWHVTFFRLNLISWNSNQLSGHTLMQWKDITEDSSYLADLKKIVDYIGTKPGVYVMVTLFSHPSQNPNTTELPTADTMPIYKKLAETFLDSSHVLYGVTNEPHSTTDAAVWSAMNQAVETLRNVEPANGPHHIIAVQGTQNWARKLEYYVRTPITAGGGTNIVYETHVYSPESGIPGVSGVDWKSQFIDPAETLPVIIGEYGPATDYMSLDQSKALMAKAEELEIPYIGWSFSSQNKPAMLQGGDYDECVTPNWSLVPTEWGQAIKDRLATPW